MTLATPESTYNGGYNAYTDPALLGIAGSDTVYLNHLAAAEIARRRLEADPGNTALLNLKSKMDVALVEYQIANGYIVPPPIDSP